MVEDSDDGAREVLRRLHKQTGKAHIIGLTGSPGSGKSTLACRLAQQYRSAGLSVGIICVDPTSPFTGGALLGDRVRMQELSGDPEVFIRSMGSRGALGGLSVATNDVINILDAFGKDFVIVETVGAGQVEIEVVKYAHTCIVVTMPGAGDEIQAIKAGILEIGDIFVVNKADREGADRTARELATMLDFRPAAEGSWNPQVLKTEAQRGTGIEELVGEILLHRDHLLSSGTINDFLRERNERHFMDILRDSLIKKALDYMVTDATLDRVVAGMGDHTIDPYSAAEQVLARMMGDR